MVGFHINHSWSETQFLWALRQSKVVCEGSMGMCVFIELQKGKISVARQKWCREYKATNACTVRLLDKMGTKEVEGADNTLRWLDNRGKKRCV